MLVVKRTPGHRGLPTETQMTYRGPFTISEILPSDMYRITTLDTSDRFHSTTVLTIKVKFYRHVCDDGDQVDPSSDRDES